MDSIFNKRNYFLFCLIAVFPVSCEKTELVSYKNEITGKWDWIFSCGGVAGCITKDAVSYTQWLEFTEDSIYYRYLNDTLIRSGEFHLYTLKDPLTDETKNYLQFENGRLFQYNIHRDTLGYEVFPRYGIVYKRIR